MTGAASGWLPSNSFFKDRQGIVHLKGGITCPGTSQNAFFLPPGYRPADNKAFFVDGIQFRALN